MAKTLIVIDMQNDFIDGSLGTAEAVKIVDNVKANLNEIIYNTLVPRNVRLAEAPSFGLPINLYDSRSAGAEAYRALAEEVIHNKLFLT